MWHVLKNSIPADSSDINDNFDHVAAGSRLPMSSVGSSFGYTDNVYNIATSTNVWDKCFANNILCNSLTTSDKFMMSLVDEVTLTSTEASIQFTGINDIESNLFEIIVSGSFSTNTSICYLTMNNDFSNNFRKNFIIGTGSTAYSSLESTGALFIGMGGIDTTTTKKFFCRSFMNISYLISIPTCLISDSINGIDDNYISSIKNIKQMRIIGQTVTSLLFFSSNSDLDPGTNIKIYARV